MDHQMGAGGGLSGGKSLSRLTLISANDDAAVQSQRQATATAVSAPKNGVSGIITKNIKCSIRRKKH